MIYALVLACLLAVANGAAADELLKPYVLGSTATGLVADQVDGVVAALEQQGFTIVGRYTPHKAAQIFVISSDELSMTAIRTPFGGYGAVQRVSLTQVGDQVQIAYTNPAYIANAYRLDGQLEDTAKKLQAALGQEKYFGSQQGISAKALRKYHYTIMMPYFDDQDKLAQHTSHAEAVAAVEAGLTAGSGAEKIYRVDVGNETVLFGVAIKTGKGADDLVIKNCDRQELKHTSYMPYELLVTGDTIHALPGKFRIAISFPDLSMGTFMKISGAPGAIKKTLKQVAAGT